MYRRATRYVHMARVSFHGVLALADKQLKQSAQCAVDSVAT